MSYQQQLGFKTRNKFCPYDYILLSLDVTSLFTNIPLQLVLDSLDKIFVSIHNKCKIRFNEIVMCTKFLFNNTFFSFYNEYYRQIDGNTDEFSHSPLFADFVMDDLKRTVWEVWKKTMMSTHYFTSLA